MPLTWKEHKGKRILISDNRPNTPEQMVDEFRVLSDILKESTERVPLLYNVEGTNISAEFMEVSKALGKEVQPRFGKTAVIGIVGVKRILLKAYIVYTGHEDIRTFETVEDGLEWLAE